MTQLPLQEVINQRFKSDSLWKNSLAILNDLGWNISWLENEGQWILLSGDQPILLSDTKEKLQIFVYGMAFSVADFPEELYLQVKREFGIE